MQDDDSKWSSVSLTYKDDKGAENTILDQDYPYEFTIPIEKTRLEFMVKGKNHHGKISRSEWQVLGE